MRLHEKRRQHRCSCRQCLLHRFHGALQQIFDEPAVILEKVRENKGANYGYNARSDEYGDLVTMGVIDPTKVTRYALQNAASVASLLLTTEAMVAEIPKKEKPMPAGGGGGGMGGMDF